MGEDLGKRDEAGERDLAPLSPERAVTVAKAAAGLLGEAGERDPARVFNELAERCLEGLWDPAHLMVDAASLVVAFANAGGRVDPTLALKGVSEAVADGGAGQCDFGGDLVAAGDSEAVRALALVLLRVGRWPGPAAEANGGRERASDEESDEKFVRGVVDAARTAALSIEGPRCPRREWYLALGVAVERLNGRFGTDMPTTRPRCRFSSLNPQCLGIRCPFSPATLRRLLRERAAARRG